MIFASPLVLQFSSSTPSVAEASPLSASIPLGGGSEVPYDPAGLPQSVQQYIAALSSWHGVDLALLTASLDELSFSYTAGNNSSLGRHSFLHHVNTVMASGSSSFDVTWVSLFRPFLGVALHYTWTKGGGAVKCSGFQHLQIEAESGKVASIVDFSADFLTQGATCFSTSYSQLPAAVSSFFDVYDTGHTAHCPKLSKLLSPDFSWEGHVFVDVTLYRNTFIPLFCQALNIFFASFQWRTTFTYSVPGSSSSRVTAVFWRTSYSSWLPWKRGEHSCSGFSTFYSDQHDRLTKAIAFLPDINANPGCNMLKP